MFTFLSPLVFASFLFASFFLSAFSYAPDASLFLEKQKKSTEYESLKKLQENLVEIQILEMALKNRRFPELESRVSTALDDVKFNGKYLESQFEALAQEQLQSLDRLKNLCGQFGKEIGVSEEDCGSALYKITQMQGREKYLYVKSSLTQRTYILLSLTGKRLGSKVIWKLGIPQDAQTSFWRVVRRKMESPHPLLRKTYLTQALNSANELFSKGEKAYLKFYQTSFSRVSQSFDEPRFHIFQKLEEARRSLLHFASLNSSMGISEETGALYNQILDNLFAYGVDLTLGQEGRDMTLQGFLFGRNPEEASELLKKLKFYPNGGGTYNSPNG